MKLSVATITIGLSLLVSACGGNDQQENSSTDQMLGEKETVLEEKQDTTLVSMVLLKIMGKENMIQGEYMAGHSEEEFIKASAEHPYFQELVKVDIKGGPYAQVEEGFKENADGSIQSKMDTYKLTVLDKSEVSQAFRISIITKVKDYKTWKMLFDMQEKNRVNAGMRLLQLGTKANDNNEVFMLVAIDDIAKAREMMDQPGLEAKMEQAGVIGKPLVKFWRLAGPQSEEL